MRHLFELFILNYILIVYNVVDSYSSISDRPGQKDPSVTCIISVFLYIQVENMNNISSAELEYLCELIYQINGRR